MCFIQKHRFKVFLSFFCKVIQASILMERKKLILLALRLDFTDHDMTRDPGNLDLNEKIGALKSTFHAPFLQSFMLSFLRLD